MTVSRGRFSCVWSVVSLLGVCLWVVPPHAQAADVVIADFLEAKTLPPQSWELAVHQGEPNISYVMEEGGRALRLRSDRSSSYAIQRKIDVDLKRTPFLVWDWKVVKLPHRGDFTRASHDDQAAQLIVVLSKKFFERTKVISYVWGGRSPKGTMGEAAVGDGIPFLDVRAVVVESGGEKTGEWLTEVRNVLKDCAALYGAESDSVVAVRIQINSQHTESEAESLWRTIRFTDRPPTGADGS